jgi:hypothetical protein
VLSREQMLAFGVVWVGGMGLVFFLHPEVICRMFKQDPTPRRLRIIHVIGAVELWIVFCGCALDFWMGF